MSIARKIYNMKFEVFIIVKIQTVIMCYDTVQFDSDSHLHALITTNPISSSTYYRYLESQKTATYLISLVFSHPSPWRNARSHRVKLGLWKNLTMGVRALGTPSTLQHSGLSNNVFFTTDTISSWMVESCLCCPLYIPPAIMNNHLMYFIYKCLEKERMKDDKHLLTSVLKNTHINYIAVRRLNLCSCFMLYKISKEQYFIVLSYRTIIPAYK
jgi:hypothetical protein